MKTARAFVTLVLAAAIAVLLLAWRRGDARLRAAREALRGRTTLAEQRRQENQRVSDTITAASRTNRLSDAGLGELLKLRNEAGQLQRTLQAMDRFRRELERTRDGLKKLEEENRRGATAQALFADELEQQTRRERVASLKQRLGEKPEQQIPELKFVTDEQLMRSMSWTPVTDDEFESYLAMLRSSAEAEVGRRAFQAVKAYAREHDNRFPTDLSQLKPYFTESLEDEILQRYTIVPAGDLNPKLSHDLGDWVITQKAPITPRDGRFAIGLEHMRTIGGGRDRGLWDPAAR